MKSGVSLALRSLALAMPMQLSGYATAHAADTDHLEAAAAIHSLGRSDSSRLQELSPCETATEIDGRRVDSERLPARDQAGRLLLPSAEVLVGSDEAIAAFSNPVTRPPVPRSALISDRNVAIESTSVDWKPRRLTLFTHPVKTQGRSLVAVVAAGTLGGDATHHVVWYRQPSNSLNLAALEHLYRHALDLDATKSFSFTVVDRQGAPVDADGASLDHPELLRQLAVARQCAAALVQAPQGVSVVPWRAVAIVEDAVAGASDPDVVSVSVVDARGRPMQGDVSFWRLPHSGCNARIGPDGRAACRLEDSHGHDDHAAHEEHQAAPVLATFPGKVELDVLLLPTTRLIPRCAAPTGSTLAGPSEKSPPMWKLPDYLHLMAKHRHSVVCRTR